MESIWGKHSLTEGEVKYFSAGDLHLWLKYQNEEVWIARAYEDELTVKKDLENPPAEVEWGRWAIRTDGTKLQLTPVFPDLPLIIRSEYELKISQGTKIQIYSRIPVWARITPAEEENVLAEFPTIKLSRTWFGTPIEGELCYHATTKARRDLSHVDKKPYVVSCPILIHNKSDEILNFEHFCFRVERLSIYDYEGDFWADETQIIYHGEDMNSDVIMTGKLPKGIDRKKLVSKPRKKIQKSLATRTFKRIFEDTIGWGG